MADSAPGTYGPPMDLSALRLVAATPCYGGVVTQRYMQSVVALLQMGTSVVSSHMVGRASFRAGQVRHDLLVVDELSDGPAHEEPRGAP